MRMMKIFFQMSSKMQFFFLISAIILINIFNSSVGLLFAILGKTLIILIMSYVLTLFLRQYKHREYVNPNGKAVLITGK